MFMIIDIARSYRRFKMWSARCQGHSMSTDFCYLLYIHQTRKNYTIEDCMTSDREVVEEVKAYNHRDLLEKIMARIRYAVRRYSTLINLSSFSMKIKTVGRWIFKRRGFLTREIIKSENSEFY